MLGIPMEWYKEIASVRGKGGDNSRSNEVSSLYTTSHDADLPRVLRCGSVYWNPVCLEEAWLC